MARKDIRTISIFCAACRRVHPCGICKAGGGLVKCLEDRIVDDRTAGDLKCPHCGQEFARFKMIQGQRAHKIIQGKVYTKGMSRK